MSNKEINLGFVLNSKNYEAIKYLTANSDMTENEALNSIIKQWIEVILEVDMDGYYIDKQKLTYRILNEIESLEETSCHLAGIVNSLRAKIEAKVK